MLAAQHCKFFHAGGFAARFLEWRRPNETSRSIVVAVVLVLVLVLALALVPLVPLVPLVVAVIVVPTVIAVAPMLTHPGFLHKVHGLTAGGIGTAMT